MFPPGVSTRAAGGHLLAGVLLGAALLSGCHSTTHGNPVASPNAGPAEPSFPKGKPSIPSPAPTRPGPPGGNPPAAAIPLSPDDSGHVFIETKSGQTRCQIDNDSVGCEAQFTNSPMQDGGRANGVNVTAGGDVQWVLGNLGDIPTVTIDYKTYDAAGWTIAATESGTRFVNAHTGHGMFVSIEKVDTF
ncbi:hypothetical protein [Mycobacterium sp.]|uniref:hypothetical protein n=1 Tax=Mycobacterium sp. TaxID=1785 RepID=UPI0025E6F45D|nr:hypothetical protein [Mycobacterium sp.]